MTELECARELEAEKAMMIAVSTGGPRIQNVNQEYVERRLRVHTFLLGTNIPDPNPYGDLWAWYGKWSSGDLPTYRSRRQYLSELFQPAIDALTRRASGVAAQPATEPTGWPRVDRGVDAVRKRLETARNEEESQTVGLLCRETLISLAQAVYDPAKHSGADGVTPSSTDAYRMLEAYFGAELAGGSNDATRSHAKASLKLANELQHRRTANLRDAALCMEATRSVVNIVAIISGRR
jgi:hypothetical protein